jgi:hypothetical protein
MATYARLTSDARKQPGELILYLPWWRTTVRCSLKQLSSSAREMRIGDIELIARIAYEVRISS